MPSYAAVRVTLEPGDTLVLFSDGVTEAADPEDEMFGIPRLSEASPATTTRPSINSKKEWSIPSKVLRAAPARPTTSLSSSSATAPPPNPPNPAPK